MEKASERVLRIAQEIERRTACRHYRLKLNEERKPTITGSKAGGLPYWPSGLDYPTDAKGHKMRLVMQVNCGEAALRQPLPEHGLLQWFISDDPELMYGCQGNWAENNQGFSIVYHATIDKKGMAVEEITPASEFTTPVKRETAIDIATATTATGVSDGRFNELFFEIVHELTGVKHEGKRWYEYLDNDDCLFLERHLGMRRPCHQMLGYPVFTQDDARRDIHRHDTLLFQLDSQFSAHGNNELIMWGDMGSGFVFINRDDLAKREFDRCYYCWDCG